jgi:hypothetical protein
MREWKRKAVDVQGTPQAAKVVTNCLFKLLVSKRLLSDTPFNMTLQGRIQQR